MRFLLVRRLLQSGCCGFKHTINFIFGEYTYNFVMHMMYNILFVDMVVYNMQV